MSQQSRDTLKSYFAAGRRPSADEFADLVDSTLNIQDEGFSKTPADGLRISSLGANPALMSFYSAASAGAEAEWVTAFAGGRRQFTISRPAAGDAPVLTLDATDADIGEDETDWRWAVTGERPVRTRVGVNNPEPREALDVGGAIRSYGRIGHEVGPLLADGLYKPLTGDLRGCHAFEVVAGVGHRNTGRFALMHAIALNTFNPYWWYNPFGIKRRIVHHHAYYSRPADRLQLRWTSKGPFAHDKAKRHGADGVYRLEIRTRRNYCDARRSTRGASDPGQVYFRAYVTQLWFDDLREDWAPHPAAPK